MRESDREGRIMIKVIKKDGTKEEALPQKEFMLLFKLISKEAFKIPL